MPVDEDYNSLINTNTYEGEFFQEEGGLTGHFMIDLTGGQGMDVDGDGDGVEEEVEDIDDLAFLDRFSSHNEGAAEESEASVDDTRDSDDETDAPLTDARREYGYPDPDDPDFDQYMYAFYLFYLVYLLSMI